ncbi:MAG: hypothetical protein V1872_06005 [bacterium]
MAILKFKTFNELDEYEQNGKGINWHFEINKEYLNKALNFTINIPIPKGIFKFKTFEKAEKWELERWVVASGSKKRTL